MIIGIDPGMSGGIAILKNNQIEVFKMPKTTPEILKMINMRLEPVTKIFIEKVVMRPQDIKSNGKADSAKIGRAMRMQSLFAQYKQLLTILELLEVEVIEIVPQTWQRYLNLYVKKEDYQVRKKRLAGIAKEMFAPMKVINQVADALLILRYGMKVTNTEII
jgi:predicted nuclease with RNAse H fold